MIYDEWIKPFFLIVCLLLPSISYSVYCVIAYKLFLAKYGAPEELLVNETMFRFPINQEPGDFYTITTKDTGDTLCFADGLMWKGDGGVCLMVDEPTFTPWPFLAKRKN